MKNWKIDLFVTFGKNEGFQILLKQNTTIRNLRSNPHSLQESEFSYNIYNNGNKFL